jgi:FdhD protein
MIDRSVINKGIVELPVVRLTRGGKERLSKPVVKECSLKIIFNGRKAVTLVSSQDDLDELAVGYLSAECLLEDRKQIKDIRIDYETGIILLDTFEDKNVQTSKFQRRVVGSGYGRGIAYLDSVKLQDEILRSDANISVSEILDVTKKFQHSSITYKNTHGVHSAALCKGLEKLVFREDIGRHNAIDKVLGHCILNDVPTENHILLTSGRICSEAIQKVARRGIPIIISIASPTCRSIEIAQKKGITLIASVEDDKMDVYTHDWRIL